MKRCIWRGGRGGKGVIGVNSPGIAFLLMAGVVSKSSWDGGEEVGYRSHHLLRHLGGINTHTIALNQKPPLGYLALQSKESNNKSDMALLVHLSPSFLAPAWCFLGDNCSLHLCGAVRSDSYGAANNTTVSHQQIIIFCWLGYTSTMQDITPGNYDTAMYRLPVLRFHVLNLFSSLRKV